MFVKKRFFNKKFVRGFTLVEIVVVLVILAILVATAVPSLIGFVDDAKKKSLANEVRAVYTAAQAYATEHFGNGDLNDDQIKNAICGLINSEHSLYYLLQKDATGTILDADVENGKVKSIKYTKDSINNLEADYFIDDNVQFVKLDTDTGAIVNASSAVTNINLDDFKAEIMADMKSNFKTNFKSDIVDLAYPVGSYYVSHNSTSPETLFGGKWTQITGRFLYCANSSGITGGSKKILVENLPAHNHGYKFSLYTEQHDAWRSGMTGDGLLWHAAVQGAKGSDDDNDTTSYLNQTTNNTGSGNDYMPPYTTVYCWRRTE